MRDPSGISQGSGFVAFSTPEEANRAVRQSYNLCYEFIAEMIFFFFFDKCGDDFYYIYEDNGSSAR